MPTTTMVIRALTGVPLAGPVVNLALAGAANATTIYALAAGAAQVGTKSMKLKRLRYRSNAVGGNVWLQVGTGTGGAFANLIPPILVLNNMDDIIDLPERESFATITAFPTTLPGGSIDVQLEIDEIG